jgi:hypothetical protein
VEKGLRTFGLAGWKAQDLLKHDIRPIFNDNEEKREKFWYYPSHAGMRTLRPANFYFF